MKLPCDIEKYNDGSLSGGNMEEVENGDPGEFDQCQPFFLV